MVQEVGADYLKAGGERARASLASVRLLVDLSIETARSGQPNVTSFQSIQKRALLDSFAVKRFHLDYQEWQSARTDNFVEAEARPYNHQLATLSRLYTDFEVLQLSLSDLRDRTRMGNFHFSIQTIESYNGGELLARVSPVDGQLPRRVAVSDLFSLERDSSLPPPSFQTFNRLVNLEFRLRMMAQIKYEVLLRAKRDLSSKNTQWATRDVALNKFLTEDFQKVYDEVERTRAREHEDLKYYADYDEEEDEADEDDDVQLDNDTAANGTETSTQTGALNEVHNEVHNEEDGESRVAYGSALLGSTEASRPSTEEPDDSSIEGTPGVVEDDKDALDIAEHTKTFAEELSGTEEAEEHTEEREEAQNDDMLLD